MDWRSDFHSKPKRIVIKVGSSSVSKEDGTINKAFLSKLSKDIAYFRKNKIEIILVSSGAINTGRQVIDPGKKKEIATQQALAAIGQPLLMAEYHKVFLKQKLILSQNLLTHEDLRNKKRLMNTRNCLFKLLNNGVIPIINENDSVSFEEISSGDNDQLAVLVADAIDADCLVLLTEADGVYLENPGKSKPLKKIKYNEKFEVPNFGKTKPGRGGIQMKITAARKLTRLGRSVIISSFKESKPLRACLEKNKGTFFLPSEKVEKKARIASLVKNEARINVDWGAYKALLKNGSLLPVGITKVTGRFSRGDCVRLYFKGDCFGQGLVEFNNEEAKKLIGKKSSEIGKIIKNAPSQLIIHRDNLYIGQ